MATEEQLGYRDAIRQVERALSRRLHHLKEQMKHAQPEQAETLSIRVQEIEHVMQVVESLHR